jgi:hypothetical protein
MAKVTAKVGDIFPALEESENTAKNPGALVDASGNALDPWLLVKAQDLAWRNNGSLVEDYTMQLTASPEYGKELGENASWAVYTAAAEAGGLDFQQQRVGPPVKTLAPAPKT